MMHDWVQVANQQDLLAPLVQNKFQKEMSDVKSKSLFALPLPLLLSRDIDNDCIS